VADNVGDTRHLTVTPNGDIFIALRGKKRQGVIALRDTTGDGKTDVSREFGAGGGNDILWHEGSLYFSTMTSVVRWAMPAGALEPATAPDTIVRDLIAKGQHAQKSFALGRDSSLYVMISAPSNSCQVADRTDGSPGIDPCPWMDSAGGIWRFDARKKHQRLSDGHRFATGVRNVMALAMDPTRTTLYGVQMGRDQLQNNWRGVMGLERGARNPGEEFYRIDEGSDHGWPYCYYDVDAGRRLLNPEYGGDGQEVGRCARTTPPLMAFPAHSAPEALLFYTGPSFPERYRQGVFVSMHGGFNRAPLPEVGFNVTFQHMIDGRPGGPPEVFADGFRPPGGKGLMRKPMGLAQDVDGSLLVTDDTRGRVYRIRYVGS
jgi:glucose/arabinose dehydrogenase